MLDMLSDQLSHIVNSQWEVLVLWSSVLGRLSLTLSKGLLYSLEVLQLLLELGDDSLSLSPCCRVSLSGYLLLMHVQHQPSQFLHVIPNFIESAIHAALDIINHFLDLLHAFHDL
jgi:hypothetical protein